MKIAFSARGMNAYPYLWPGPAPIETRRRFFSFAREQGADGVEVEETWLPFWQMSESDLRAFRDELTGYNLVAGALKVGGNNLCHPKVRDQNLDRLLRSVEIASWLNTEVISSSLPGPAELYEASDNDRIGAARSYGSSRDASPEDFEQTARRLQQVADHAAKYGLKFAIEIHQNSIADNSSATLRLVEMTDRPNVGINPDLGNVLWTYNIPEESWADTIRNTASKMVFWHMKNMRRVYLPEANRAVFIRTNVPSGEIDYRYAIEIAHAAGFRGFISIEGGAGNTGDEFYNSAVSIGYVRSIISSLT